MFKRRADEIPDYEINVFDIEDEKEERKKGSSIVKQIVLIVLFFYIVFLMIGVLTTTYIKTSDGKRKPQIVSVELREERNYYYNLKNYYMKLKHITDKATEQDTKVKKEENLLVLASIYQELLEQLDKNWTGLKGVTVPERYSPLKKVIIEAYNTTSIYLQRMSVGLTEKDKSKLNDGLKVWKVNAQESQENIKQNMIYFAELVKICDKDLGMTTETKSDEKKKDGKKEVNKTKESKSDKEKDDSKASEEDPFKNLKSNEEYNSLTSDPDFRTKR